MGVFVFVVVVGVVYGVYDVYDVRFDHLRYLIHLSYLSYLVYFVHFDPFFHLLRRNQFVCWSLFAQIQHHYLHLYHQGLVIFSSKRNYH